MRQRSIFDICAVIGTNHSYESLSIIEFIVPVVYIVSLVVALYGPNSSILGNYGNGYWTFRRIESLDKYVFTAIEMFLFDCASFIVGGLILWKYCSISFFQEICLQMKTNWIFIAITVAKAVNVVLIFTISHKVKFE